MIDEQVKDKERRIAEQIREAVASGDACAFLQLLESGGVLAGYKHGLRSRFRYLDDSDLDRVLGESPDELYSALQKRTIADPLGYLYKVMCNKCAAANAARRIEVPLDREHRSPATEPDDEREKLWSRHCARGFTEAKRLVKKLPSQKQQQVIGYYIDALEKGYVDLTAAEVGVALGLSDGYVRQLKKRAIDRLREIVKEDGIELDFDFGSFDAFYEAAHEQDTE